MSGLAHIRDHFKPWDTTKHHDYKVRSMAFVCPAEAFKPWDDFKVQAWVEDNTVYGIVSAQTQTRVGKCHSIMNGATLYRVSGKSKLELLKSICATNKAYKDSSEKQLMVDSYNDYVQSMYE
jgi:hypothetical protein